MKYRRDIDGLRAVAVMSVILAHAGVPFIAGGFLGVDVFFVISGYLITTILINDLEDGRYSLARFYERRARRILPALVAVMVACLPFALWLMLPDFLQNFGQSLVATLLFSNNILLALTSGYWELESGFKPLLHTWSLGVEEQFYMVFPLLLAGVWRFGRNAQLSMIIAIGVLSFAISEHGWRTYPDVSFYMPTSRAWELMAGCAGAYVKRKDRPIDHFLSLLSLIAVVAPMFLFDEHTPSPSVYSAIPVLGTLGIILFNRPGMLVHRLLSVKPAVFIGLISYSAYLWHQPLFAFARIASFAPPGPATMTALSGATLILAWLSWRFIEQPFRHHERVPARIFVPAGLFAVGLLVAMGFILHTKQGFPRWSFPNIEKDGDVYISYNERVRQYATENVQENGRANVILVGDSFGRDVGNILLEGNVIQDKNLIYLDNSLSPCQLPSVRGRHPYADASVIVVALHNHDADCVASIRDQAGSVSAASLVFVGTKSFGYNINPFARVPMRDRTHALATVPASDRLLNDAIADSLPESGYIDLIRLLGPDGRRIRYFDANGNPLTPDRMHLTRYGARFAAEKLSRESPEAWQVIVNAR